mgnify:CR=1 FL=1
MINRILNTDLAYCGQNRERQVCAGMKYAGDRLQAADQLFGQQQQRAKGRRSQFE